MAEERFTKVDNDLLEKIQDYKFTTNQLKIILAVLRSTAGYHKEAHAISLSFLERGTNLTRARVSSSLQDLIRHKVIKEFGKGGENKQSKIIGLNTTIEEWTIGKYKTVVTDDLDMDGSTSLQNDTSLQDDTSTSLQDDTGTGLQDDTQKRKYKEIYKENIYVQVIDYLNEKAGKRFSTDSKANRQLISARVREDRKLEDFLHVIDVKCEQWLDDPKMSEYLRPATLFSQKNFENYVNQKLQNDKAKAADPRDKEIELQKWIMQGEDPEDFKWC